MGDDILYFILVWVWSSPGFPHTHITHESEGFDVI